MFFSECSDLNSEAQIQESPVCRKSGTVWVEAVKGRITLVMFSACDFPVLECTERSSRKRYIGEERHSGGVSLCL